MHGGQRKRERERAVLLTLATLIPSRQKVFDYETIGIEIYDQIMTEKSD
jgi:hypothetical protein